LLKLIQRGDLMRKTFVASQQVSQSNRSLAHTRVRECVGHQDGLAAKSLEAANDAILAQLDQACALVLRGTSCAELLAAGHPTANEC